MEKNYNQDDESEKASIPVCGLVLKTCRKAEQQDNGQTVLTLPCPVRIPFSAFYCHRVRSKVKKTQCTGRSTGMECLQENDYQ